MTNTYKLDDPGLSYDYGDDFSYESWPTDSRVTLVNVPWNNDYRDVVEFANRAALNAYIDSLETSGILIENMSYVKPNMPVAIPTPFNVANRFNYLRVSNPIHVTGDVVKDYYYFITDVRMVNFNTTEITVQLDVWATWSFDTVFGNCYIERGHIGIANSQGFVNYGRDYLTIPEGLDVGGEYQVIAKANKAIMSPESPSTLEEDIFNILVVATIDLEQPPGTVNSPNFATAQGGSFAGMPSGANQYLWKSATALQVWLTANSGNPWITQSIISITIIPPFKELGGIALDWPTDDGPTRMPAVKWSPRAYTMLTNWRDNADIKNNIPVRYQHLYKFWTYPYMVVELTTFTGSPILLKPESWNDADATVIERINPVPPDQRMSFSPYRYNAAPASAPNDMYVGSPASGSPALGDDGGDYIDIATYIANFPSLMIVNNAGIAYLAANAHGIAFQHQSADWSQQRALKSNQVSYDQATGAIGTSKELTGIGVGADYAQQSIQQNLMAASMGLAGAGNVGGSMSGGPAGLAAGAGAAALGALTAGMQSAALSQSTDVRSNAANQSNNASNRQAGMVRDTNKSLADFSARGDYENTIAGVNARVQDAKLIQPTTSGQVGGDALNFLNNNVMLSARFKMIDQSAIRTVGEYWLRYGYAVRKFSRLPGNLQVMTKFTYWKLQETYILAAPMPEPYKQVIRGIMEKGVTVWGNPADIGNVDIADNAPLDGITL